MKAAIVYLTILTGCGGGHAPPFPADAPARAPAAPPRSDPGAPAIDESGGLPAGYTLVWADEFDADGLPDTAKWTYDTGRNSAGWYNNELQYYSAARAENARVAGGSLLITARKEDLAAAGLGDWGGQRYSSSRLVTRGKAAWTYGFIEIRAKLPCGRGSWPALWMLPAPPRTAWPDDGEIDIMEHVGFDPGVIHATMHTRAFNHVRNNARTATITVPDACTVFHKYQLTWTADRITVGVDDRNYYQYANDHSGNAEWPFDDPQYLILNVAVGGDWGGQKGVDDSIFPIRMEVDYVRVYQGAG
jgi:beta-glucanase (GH16 family)